MKTFIIIFFMALAVPLLKAQTQNPQNLIQRKSYMDRESPKYQTSFEKFYKNRAILQIGSPQILEQEIPDSLYIVGPGDQLNIHIFGELETEFPVTVLPEGSVILPSIGSLPVAGLSLKEVKQKIRSFIGHTYIKADVKVDLTGMRKFRVYLVGEVQKPGTYFAQASDRVSDVIQIAEGLTDWADETGIQVRHLNGSTDTLNISRFLRFAEKNSNPTVSGGDVIYVPPIDLNTAYVLVESHKQKNLEIQNTNPNQVVPNKTSIRKIYHLLKGETLRKFLERIGSYSAEIDLSRITLVRNGEERIIDMLDQQDSYNDFSLQNKDLLIIPDLIHEVYVQGEVNLPGAYSYNVNLTANDYVGKAGVLETAKGSDAIIVIHASAGKVEHGGKVIVEKGDTIIVPRKNRELVRDYIGIIAPVVSMLISTYSFYLTVTRK